MFNTPYQRQKRKRQQSTIAYASPITKRLRRTPGYGQRGFLRTGGYYGRFNRVVQRPNQELKFWDTERSGDFDVTGEVLGNSLPVGIAAGTGEEQRLGRKIVIKKISINGIITQESAAANGCCMMALVLDKQCNGAVPTWTDIFEDQNFTTFNNLANSQRFKIIKKWYMVFNSNMITNIANNAYLHADWRKLIRYNKKCNIPIEYDSTTGAITEIKSYNFFLVGIASGNDDVISYSCNCRLRFTDV